MRGQKPGVRKIRGLKLAGLKSPKPLTAIKPKKPASLASVLRKHL